VRTLHAPATSSDPSASIHAGSFAPSDPQRREAKAAAAFDAFCREAIDFLIGASTPYLVIGGLAVAVIGEPRMTGDIDVIGYLSTEQAMVLIDAAIVAGFEVAADERERLHATGTLRFGKGRFQLDIILASLPFARAEPFDAVDLDLALVWGAKRTVSEP
jgi:hypothetical protein